MTCINEEAKAFTGTNFMTRLMQRRALWVNFATTCATCGRKTRIALMWENPQIVAAEDRATDSPEAVDELAH